MKKILLVISLAALAFSMASCGSNKKPELKLVCGSETLTVAKLAAYSPDSIHDMAGLVSAAKCRQLANAAPDANDSAAAADLADLLSRETSVTYQNSAKANLYKACHGALKILGGAAPQKIADSLSVLICQAKTILPKSSDSLVEMLGYLFSNVKQDSIIASFVRSESVQAGSGANVSSLVKGLIGSKTAAAKAVKKEPVAKTVTGKNSDELLKLRPMKSISETMERNLQYFEGIYRKNLKLDPSIRGTVVLHFEVEPSGKVAKVSVSASAIKKQELLDEETAYASKIMFAPIPDSAGIMTFEYPLEFQPED